MTETTALNKRVRTYTIAQAVLSGLGFITTLPSAGFFLIIAFVGILSEPNSLQSTGPVLVFGWTSLLISLIFAFALVKAIFRLRGKDVPAVPEKWLQPLKIGVLLVWAVSVLMMVIASLVPQIGFVLSPFVLPLIVVPLLVFIYIGARRLSMGSRSRIWGSLTFNLSVTMPVILMLELFIFIAIFLVAAIWISNQPELVALLMRYSEQLAAGDLDPVLLERMVNDLLSRPVVLNGSLLVIAVIVPFMEELLKPMALWFLAGKRLTPRQGFVGGLIAGSSFAMLESLGAIGIPSDLSWFGLLVGRTGTGLLHITLSGLVGWGLASAFYNGNWLRAIGNYLLAVLIHGIWNLFALLSGIVPILPVEQNIGQLPRFLSQIGPGILVLLAVINIVILLSTNRRFRRLQSESETV